MDRELAYGQRIVVVVDAVVTSVGRAKGPNGPITARKLSAVDLYELDDERGATVLKALRIERRYREEPSGAGGDELPGFEVNTDGTGVVMTPDEVADVMGTAADEPVEQEPEHDGRRPELAAGDWLRAHAREVFDALVEPEAGETIAVLRNLSALDLTTIRAAITFESFPEDDARGEVLDYLDERLALELARVASEEPFELYKTLGVKDIKARLDAARSTLPRWGFSLMLEAVEAFEKAHKNRAGVLDFVASLTTVIPPAPDDVEVGGGESEAGAGPEVGGEEPDLGDGFEPDGDIELDDESEAGDESS